jgi:hypothetical protein
MKAWVFVCEETRHSYTTMRGLMERKNNKPQDPLSKKSDRCKAAH